MLCTYSRTVSYTLTHSNYCIIQILVNEVRLLYTVFRLSVEHTSASNLCCVVINAGRPAKLHVQLQDTTQPKTHVSISRKFVSPYSTLADTRYLFISYRGPTFICQFVSLRREGYKLAYVFNARQMRDEFPLPCHALPCDLLQT